MVKLVRDDPAAAPEALVLEVDRVEDARTVRQRLHVPAAEWQEFLRTEDSSAAPGTAEEAYLAQKEFWDWLAGEHAGVPPEGPSTGSHEQPVAPSAAWLSARYREWQDRT
jgi:hypothetical protein